MISALIANFLEEYEIDHEFMMISSSASSEEILVIPKETLLQLNVINDGATPVKFETITVDGGVYVRAERYTIFGHHKIILLCTPQKELLFWALAETQGRDSEMMSFPLARVLLNGEPAIDLSERVDRKVVNGYLNAIAPITVSEAIEIAKAKRVGFALQGSKDDGVFLGVGDMEIEDGAKDLLSLIQLCD